MVYNSDARPNLTTSKPEKAAHLACHPGVPGEPVKT